MAEEKAKSNPGCLIVIVLIVLAGIIGANASGDKTFAVPDVTGMSYADAKKTLSDAGFSSTPERIRTNGEKFGGVSWFDECPVIEQSILPGETIKIRDSIVLTCLTASEWAAYVGQEAGENNLRTIRAAWEENEINAEETYAGKHFVIAGQVNKISSGGNLAHITTNPVITVFVKDGADTLIVYAEFSKDDEEQLQNLSAGDDILIAAKCSNWGNWKDCVLAE